LRQRVRVVRILRNDHKLTHRSRFRRQRDRRFQSRSAGHFEKHETCSTDTDYDDCRQCNRSRHALTLHYKAICERRHILWRVLRKEWQFPTENRRMAQSRLSSESARNRQSVATRNEGVYKKYLNRHYPE
jgi:hypothetical protein